MKSNSATIALRALALCAVIGTGCNQNGSSAPNAAASASPGLTAKPPPTDSTLLRDGLPPMSYMLGSGGKLRVMDATAKEELAQKTVAPQSIILVDADKGVMIGTVTLVQGPIPKDHRYELWLDR